MTPHRQPCRRRSVDRPPDRGPLAPWGCRELQVFDECHVLVVPHSDHAFVEPSLPRAILGQNRVHGARQPLFELPRIDVVQPRESMRRHHEKPECRERTYAPSENALRHEGSAREDEEREMRVDAVLEDVATDRKRVVAEVCDHDTAGRDGPEMLVDEFACHVAPRDFDDDPCHDQYRPQPNAVLDAVTRGVSKSALGPPRSVLGVVRIGQPHPIK